MGGLLTVNAFTLSYLAKLKAVEAAPLAEEIFKAGRAELEVAGDYEDYQIRVGLLKQRFTPSKFGTLPNPEVRQVFVDISANKNPAREKDKKEKNKRKQAKKTQAAQKEIKPKSKTRLIWRVFARSWTTVR